VFGLYVNNKKSAVCRIHFKLMSFNIFVCGLLLCSSALSDGTLSGTVVDATDGVTPVYPVIVALIDPVTGEDPPGLDAATDSDGFYEITAIPAGDYKVHFNAVNTANGYVDELYNGIPCDNGGCGMSVLGDVIAIADELITLNVDLERAFLLSGNVTNQSAQAIAGLNIEVYDEAGNGVCCDGTTDDLGEWSMPVPQPGSYYVRIDNRSTQVYVPEIWDDIVCDDCDPVATGDPIVVTDGDVGGIDFQLEPIKDITGACSSGDMISTGGFEDLPAYSIEFITDSSTVFTTSGQQAEFAVEYLDELGFPLDPSTLEWCLGDETNLDISPNGLTATVNSTGFEFGSVNLLVRDPVTSIFAQASIMFADLTADGNYLSSDVVLDNGGGVGNVVLVRNAQTELIQPGDVLISGDVAGLLVRVLTVTLTGDQVILTVESAKITDAFENLDISSASQAQKMAVHFDAKTNRVTVETSYEISNKTRQVSSQQFSIAGLDCKAEDKSDFGLSLTGGTIDWEIKIELDGSLKITNRTVQEFSFSAKESLILTAKTGQLKFSTKLEGEVTCELPIPRYDTPTLPISVFSFGLSVQPKVGVKVSGSINGPSFSIDGPQGKLTDTAIEGLKYTIANGWEPIAGISRQVATQPFTAAFNSGIKFSLDVQAFGGVGFGIIANLGKGFFSIELAAVEFAEVISDVTLHGEFSLPFDPMVKEYTGPKWDITGHVKGEFKAELTSGGLFDLLKALDVPTTLPLSGNIFAPIEVPILNSPQPGSVSVSCIPVTCLLDPEGTDHANITVSTDDVRQGQVQYLGSIDGASDLSELVSSELFNSSSLGVWDPTQNDPDGTYHAYVRIKTDALSNEFPYAFDTVSLREVIVGSTNALEVQKIDKDTGLATTNGNVVSEPAGIVCGDTCQASFEADSMVTLTASGFKFVEWGAGGACAGSTEPICDVMMNADKTAKAVFESLDDITLIRSDRMSAGNLEAIPGEVYPELLEVRAVTDQGVGVGGIPIVWLGHGSARGGAWDMRQWWEENDGQDDDDEVIVYTDDQGYASVPWKLGHAQCNYGDTSPRMRAHIQDDESVDVAFQASYSPYDQRDNWPEPRLVGIEVTSFNITPDTNILTSMSLLITWEDPLGALDSSSCAGIHNITISPSGNRAIGAVTLSDFVNTRSVLFFSIGVPADSVFTAATQLNVVGSRSIYISDSTEFTVQ